MYSFLVHVITCTKLQHVHDIYTVNDRNDSFSGTPVTGYMLSFGKLVVNPVHFLLTENITRNNQGIIV